MNYKPAIICLFVFCVAGYTSIAQRAKIDSLKNRIAYLHENKLINGLNTLSMAYSYINPDSAEFYANNAYRQAGKINYQHGLGIALNNKAHILGVVFHNFPLEEKICNETLQFFELNDAEVSEAAYLNLVLSLFCQGQFDRSAIACNEAAQIAKKTKDYKVLGESTALLGSISFETGNYNQSFDYFNRALGIFITIKDDYNTAILLDKIGDLHYLAGDEKGALKLYYESLSYPKDPLLTWHPLEDLGDTYYSLAANSAFPDDEEKYMESIKSLTIRSNYISFPKILSSEKYVASHKFKKALTLLDEELNFSKLHNDRNETMRLLMDIARAYQGEQNFSKAILYSRLLLQNALVFKLRQYARDGYQLLFSSYEQLHQTDSAYYYYKRYTVMKDSVAVDEFSRKLAIFKAVTENEKKEQQIVLLNKEKLINLQELQLSAQHLKSESFLKNILIASVIAIFAFAFIIFRSIRLKQKNEAHRHELVEKEFRIEKAESERDKSEMQQQAIDLEMQALRAQMNPHFIFNCLNSINRFIIANNAAQAANHLTKFAKLIRLVLEQSGKSFISLEDELYCLQLYMDLEALRFEIPFKYEINTNGINTSVVMIPSLLIQPFVENAIWHGLNGSANTNGKIRINMSLQNSILHCGISDNGIGRKKIIVSDEKLKDGKKSLGIELTRNRLQLIDPSKAEEAGITIYDLTNESGESAGTCVDIKIPVKEI